MSAPIGAISTRSGATLDTVKEQSIVRCITAVCGAGQEQRSHVRSTVNGGPTHTNQVVGHDPTATNLNWETDVLTSANRPDPVPCLIALPGRPSGSRNDRAAALPGHQSTRHQARAIYV